MVVPDAEVLELVVVVVVDQDRRRPELLARLGDGGLECAAVGDGATQEERSVPGSAELARERLSGLVLKIEERHTRAVAREGAHEALADAARPAADQYDLVLEAFVLGETHAMRRSVCGSNRQAV